jgi:hypothetical protein
MKVRKKTTQNSNGGKRGMPFGIKYTLTEKGAARAVIVLANAPTCAAAFGAAELQDHIQRISGAMLPVVSGDSDIEINANIKKIANYFGGTRIFVGENKALTNINSSALFTNFQSQEYAVYALPKDIVLIGRDSPGMNSKEREAVLVQAKEDKVAPLQYGEYDAFPDREIGRTPSEHPCHFTGEPQVIHVPYVKFDDDEGSVLSEKTGHKKASC